MDISTELIALGQQALQRLPDGASPDALDRALAGLDAAAPTAPLTRAWLQARARFVADALRRALVPEGAEVILVGGALEATLHRLPAGLVTPRAVHLIDHPEALRARAARLEAAGFTAHHLPEAPASPDDLAAVLGALGRLPLRPGAEVAVVLQRATPRAPVEAALAFAEALLTLPGRSMTLAFTCFTPEVTRDPRLAAALTSFGAPWGLRPLGIELALRALREGAEVRTTPLLRLGDRPVALGVRASWPGGA